MPWARFDDEGIGRLGTVEGDRIQPDEGLPFGRYRLSGTLLPANRMVFSRRLSEMTRFLAFYPDDVIWIGADALTKGMVPGDVVEIGIEGIGALCNFIVPEADSA